MQNNKEYNLFIMGFGNAAKAFCVLLEEKLPEIQKNLGCKINIVTIWGNSKGPINSNFGIDLENFNFEYNLTGSFPSDENYLYEIDKAIDAKELINKSNANVFIELSPLSIFDGQPAISYIETAFKKGMHVITANKGPIAWDFHRLNSLAQAKSLGFYYETTVMDGTPIFNLMKNTLPGCKVISFKGILNSTTNFVISQMEDGKNFNESVSEAKKRGFAEADPSLDLEGWDAAGKTAALANVLMDARINPTEIIRKGIEQITEKDIAYAKASGKKIKLICEAYFDSEFGYQKLKVLGKVAPAYVDERDIFSKIDATSSILSIKTDLMGEISIIENAPEIEQTAYGIYSDLYTLIQNDTL